MGWVILIVAACMLIWFIQHFVFAPHYTEPARKRFILETLRSANFAQLNQSSERISYPFRGRILGAYWIIYQRPDVGPQAVTVRFNVLPTVRTAGSVTHSEFLLIRSAEHLQQMKDKLKESDSYEEYLVYPKDVGPPPKF